MSEMLMDRPAPVVEAVPEIDPKQSLENQKTLLEVNKAAISAALAAGELVPEVLTDENMKLTREITVLERQISLMEKE